MNQQKSNKFASVSTGPITKVRHVSCKNCLRLTEIEGEQLCFRDGHIIRLIPGDDKDQQPYLCEGWHHQPNP